ncbi:MAG: O-antigen ligase family protein [Actinomycetota bacterium]|nr:O-antigen ligase family protein [Actinomycetota bacterium]
MSGPRHGVASGRPRSRTAVSAVWLARIRQDPVSWAVSAGVFLLLVGDIPGVSYSVFAPKLAVLLVMGAAGLPVLVLRAMGAGTSVDRALTRPAAVAAIVFVLVAAVSTALSPAVESAVVGVYQLGTGLVFVACLAGVWALGTCVSPRGRELLVSAVVAAAMVNAVVGIAQQLIGLPTIPADGLLATGLMGNPVFFGALSVAALALLAPRFIGDPRRSAVQVVLVSAAVGISGERLSAALMLVLVAFTAAVVVVRPATGDVRRARVRVAWFAAAAIVSLIVGSLLPSAAAGTGGGIGDAGVFTRTAQSTVANTLTGRFDVWRAGLSVLAHRPVVGFGPGQFRDAISTLSGPRYTSLMASSTFDDAHNIVIEYLTTTGVLGAIAFVTWLVLAARRRRGPLLVAAGLLLVIGLVEPQNVVTTPLMFLLLGAAPVAARRERRSSKADDGAAGPGGIARRDGRTAPGGLDRAGSGDRVGGDRADGRLRAGGGVPGGRPAVIVSTTLAVLALLAGIGLVVGDAEYRAAAASSAGGQEQAAVRQARSADHLLFPWPDAQVLVARSLLLEGSQPTPANAAAAANAYRIAISRDPTDADLWSGLGMAELHAGQPAAAFRAASRAVQLRPWDVDALDNLGLIDVGLGRVAQSKHWYGRSLVADPNQPVARAFYRYGCVPLSIHAFLPARYRCHPAP